MTNQIGINPQTVLKLVWRVCESGFWCNINEQGGFSGGLRGHPFLFEIFYYFSRILRKITSIHVAGKWATVLAYPFWIFWIHLCNSLPLAKKIERKFGRRTLLISLSEVAGLFFLSQLLLDYIMQYRTFETNMNFYLDHIFYYVLVRYHTYRCQFSLLLLWCWTIKVQNTQLL